MDIESQGTARTDEIEWLNRECFCVSLDHEALRTELDTELGTRELPSALVDSHPHLFAALPVFVSSRHVAQMADIIAAVEMVVGLPAYRSFVLQSAPKITRFDPGRGVCS